jgi:hypothetical protein
MYVIVRTYSAGVHVESKGGAMGSVELQRGHGSGYGFGSGSGDGDGGG